MRIVAPLCLTMASTLAAQQPAKDTTRAPQPVPTVTIEGKPDPKASTPLEARARFGGYVYTPKDFERVGARTWTDVARLAPSISFQSLPASNGSTLRVRRLVMKGGVTGMFAATAGGSRSGPYCIPTLFVDGTRYWTDQASMTDMDLDQVLALEMIKRIEIYSVATVPQQYKAVGEGGGCGSILLWTHEERPADEKKSP